MLVDLSIYVAFLHPSSISQWYRKTEYRNIGQKNAQSHN